MFAQVALKEKQSSVCFFEMASVELQYFLLFDLNVKKVKAGRSQKEGLGANNGRGAITSSIGNMQMKM